MLWKENSSSFDMHYLNDVILINFIVKIKKSYNIFYYKHDIFSWLCWNTKYTADRTDEGASTVLCVWLSMCAAHTYRGNIMSATGAEGLVSLEF